MNDPMNNEKENWPSRVLVDLEEPFMLKFRALP